MTDSFSKALANLGPGVGEGREGTVDRAASSGSGGRDRTFEIQVELQSRPYDEYSYDAERRAFRLQAVVRPEHPLPGDCGALAGTLGTDWRPLAAVLLVTRPTIPGCLVESHLLGRVELASGETRIVAVPEADSAFREVSCYRDLKPDKRRDIERLVLEMADGTLPSGRLLRWFTPEEAVEVVREAQCAVRLAVAANRRWAARPPGRWWTRRFGLPDRSARPRPIARPSSLSWTSPSASRNT